MAYGNIGAPAIRCGTLILDEPHRYRKTYETASWFTEIEVPAGEYELTTNGYWGFSKLPGTITDEHFVNRVFQYTSTVPKRNIGNPDTYHWQTYDYNLAESFVNDPTHYILDDDWRVEMRQWWSSYHPSKPLVRRCMFKLVPPKED